MSRRQSGSIRQALAPFARPDMRLGVWQLAATLAGYAAAMFLIYLGLSYGYSLSLSFAFVAALFTVRLFVIQHDCGHESFFPSRRANNLTGAFIGVLTLTPYNDWRRRHAVHHRVSGNLAQRGVGDIETLTVREYLALSPRRRLGYRIARHPLVLFGLAPAYQFFMRHRLPADPRTARRAHWWSVMGTNAAVFAVVWLAIQAVGARRFLLVQLIVSWAASAIGIWLFYVQHQFEHTYWAADEEWNFERACVAGSSFLDLHPVLRWFTGNIGYHHIHHLSPKVPNYRLPACADVHPDLATVQRLTLRDALRCSRLAVWDEQRRMLVPLASAHAAGDGAGEWGKTCASSERERLAGPVESKV